MTLDITVEITLEITVEIGKTGPSRALLRHLIDAVRAGRADIVADAGERFGVAAASVDRHLEHLGREGFLVEAGPPDARVWRLGPNRRQTGVYALGVIAEDRVYAADFGYIVDGLGKNIQDIWYYGFTEILNNAIDHSGGSRVEITADCTPERLALEIQDDGEGIFKRIARLTELGDPRAALLELSKGKLTTDPRNHTGEGIFFTSRAFDAFRITSGDLAFSHREADPDVLAHLDGDVHGTRVSMALSPTSERTLSAVFNTFTDAETLDFSKTIIPIRLALYEGENLVSRSQAKRIMNRVERFRSVILDFTGVDTVGRSFVDEVFRVFAAGHPDVALSPVNMSPQVCREVARVLGPGVAEGG